MMSVTTHVRLREGAEPEWDDAMRARLGAAQGRPGWIRGQILMPLDAMNERLVVGTWTTRADWEAWHNDPAFLETRQRLEQLQAKSDDPVWHELIAEVEA